MHVYLISRRHFFSSVAALFASINPIIKLGTLLRKSSSPDDDFLIINGWVLKREDFAASEVEQDAV